jgi:hypothetical protein
MLIQGCLGSNSSHCYTIAHRAVARLSPKHRSSALLVSGSGVGRHCGSMGNYVPARHTFITEDILARIALSLSLRRVFPLEVFLGGPELPDKAGLTALRFFGVSR